MGNHTSDGLVEDTGRRSVMEGTGLFRVDQMSLVQELVVSELWTGVETSASALGGSW